MARWMKPEEQTPEVFVGDRIIGIVRDRKHATSKLLPRVVILEAIEGGWRDIEDSGYRLGDCELWTLESDLVHIADVVRR